MWGDESGGDEALSLSARTLLFARSLFANKRAR
jgi:hypothetical protein